MCDGMIDCAFQEPADHEKYNGCVPEITPSTRQCTEVHQATCDDKNRDTRVGSDIVRQEKWYTLLITSAHAIKAKATSSVGIRAEY